MKIKVRMNLEDLAERCGFVPSSAADYIALENLRESLCVSEYDSTEDIPENVWGDLVSEAFES